jgi:hypothetical protein
VGTKLFAAGSGNDDTWFFDYQAGLLNFNGANIPSQITTGVTGKSIYIVGYRYIGEYGVDTTFISNGTSNVQVVSSGGNVTIGVDGTSNVAVFSTGGEQVNGNISATGNITGNFFIGNGSALTGITATASSNIVGNLTVTGTASVSGNVTSGTNFVGNGSALLSTMTDRGTDQNDWNTLLQMGVYTVNRSSWSGTVGTPLDSQVFTGLLEVKNSTNTSIEQIFYPGTIESGDVKIQWNRANWNATWTPWIRIVNNDQIVLGGVY